MGAKLFKEGIIVRVERVEEEHHNEHWKKKDLAKSHVVDHPIKPGAKSHNLLRRAHTVVEK